MKSTKKYAFSTKKTVKLLKRKWLLYVFLLPALLYLVLFCYWPMYGLQIAFKDYSLGNGIAGSEWVGCEWFERFFGSPRFWTLLKNTLTISLYSMAVGFPLPIALALILNNVKNAKWKKFAQTITYMPHFISMVVVCGMITMFVSDKGIITYILTFFGGEKVSMLSNPDYFVPIYVISGIWQEVGWGAIIYLSALSGIDPQLYEAAKIDGANRWKQTIHVTLPGISGTIIIMLLLRMGSVMNVGYEKIILLYNAGIYETSDVISTFVYRKGLLEYQWSYSAAVGIFNSIINFIIVVAFNKISKKLTEVSLW